MIDVPDISAWSASIDESSAHKSGSLKRNGTASLRVEVPSECERDDLDAVRSSSGSPMLPDSAQVNALLGLSSSYGNQSPCLETMPDNLEEVRQQVGASRSVTGMAGDVAALLLLPGVVAACHSLDMPEEEEVREQEESLSFPRVMYLAAGRRAVTERRPRKRGLTQHRRSRIRNSGGCQLRRNNLSHKDVL